MLFLFEILTEDGWEDKNPMMIKFKLVMNQNK